ncbi:MAG: hypothetical protein ACRDIB_20155, partial [Ardenticatenaceae bacterium]
FILLGYVGLVLATQWLVVTRRPRWGLALLLVLVVVLGVQLVYRPQSRAFLTGPRQLVDTILQAEPPPKAILVSNDRNEIVPLWYAQFAEGRRQDMLVVAPLITQAPTHQTVSGVVDWALQWERPVLLTKPMPGLAMRYELEPYPGPLVAVAGRAPLPETPVLQSKLAPELSVIGWSSSTARPMPGQTVSVTVALQPHISLEEDLSFSLQLFGEDGSRADQEDIAPDKFFPSSLWPTGEPLRFPFTLTLPLDLRPGVYEWRLSAYVGGKGGGVGPITPVGQQVVVGRTLVDSTGATTARSGALEELDSPLAQFGDAIMLADVDGPTGPVHAGEELGFTLRWAALDAPRRPYTLFA